MQINIINQYTDDHIPCVDFTYGNIEYNLLWTDAKIIGMLECIADGDIDISVLTKKFPELYNIIIDPESAVNEDVDKDDPNRVTVYINAGCLTFVRPVK